MPRYILIDDHSGYIFGDTADLPSAASGDMTPARAAQALDESLGEHGRSYEEHGPGYRPDGVMAYHVYRADVGGSEAVPIVQDGQDSEMIRAVERDCVKVAVVTCQAPTGY